MKGCPCIECLRWPHLFVMPSIIFLAFLVHAFKIVVNSWKFIMLMLSILWNDWAILWFQVQMNSYRNWNTPNKSLIVIYGEFQKEERYAIKLCFKLGKNPIGWKLDLLQWPRDRVPSGSMLGLPDPRRPHRANPPTDFDDPFFFTVLAWSICTGFPIDTQSTRNNMLRF